VTVSTFEPRLRTIPLSVQLVVPVAVPDPPRLFVQVTWVTPTLADAVPWSVSHRLWVVYSMSEVGVVIEMESPAVSVPVPPSVPPPVTTLSTVAPFALKLTVELTVAVVVGVKRTVTS